MAAWRTIPAPIISDELGRTGVMHADLIVGDDDGVVVVRPDQLPGLMERCRARIEKEANTLRRISAGELTTKILSLPEASPGTGRRFST